jgi:hypothetical protein
VTTPERFRQGFSYAFGRGLVSALGRGLSAPERSRRDCKGERIYRHISN